MRLFIKILLGLIAALALAAVYVLNPRLPAPEGEQSAAPYRPGPLGVASQPVELIDTSRPTKPNGDFEGSSARALNGFVWYPATQDQKPFPLVVYSHGFMSSVAEPEYFS